MTPTVLLQTASALLLDLALAWLLAALMATRWLRAEADAWSLPARRRLRTTLPFAALTALAAYGAALWAAAAAMVDLPPLQAGDALITLLSHSGYGHIGVIGMLALLLLALLSAAPRRLSGRDALALALLAACMYSRAANSHAAEDGTFSVGVLVEFLHLLLICGWVGAVMVAAWLVLPVATAAGGTVCRHYLTRLSHDATLALPAIVASGAYNAWRVFGAWDKVGRGEYETVLALKLLLVLLAAAMGAYNKFIGLPAALAQHPGALTRVGRILQLEAVVLIAALAAAVTLAGLAPPASL